jgi:DNA polymerase-3 subunit delta
MGQITDSLKEKDYKRIYLIYGDEAYLRNYYKTALKTALTAPGDNLNFSYFEGSLTDPNELAGLLDTMPFMAEYRVIIAENTGFFAKAGAESDGDEDTEKASGKFGTLIDTINSQSETPSILIFAEEKVDKRSKLFKAVSKAGLTEEFKIIDDENQLARWCINYLKSLDTRISPDAAMYFVSEVGHEMTLLKNELDKLASYALDKKEITVNDIDALSTHQITGKIFDMIAAIGNHRQKEALKLYYDLLALRESPFAILALLSRQYTQMLTVKDCMIKNYSLQRIAEKTGLKDWVVRRLQDSVRKFTMDDLKKCLEACAQADEDIKAGNLTDILSVEVLIVSCSS